MNKNFIFKHFTLIFSRNCNLNCSYCQYDYEKENMSKEILDIFFINIKKYKDYNLNIALFGGEPLLNKEGFEYLYYLLNRDSDVFMKNNINIILKIPTNGTILNDYYVKLFKKIKALSFVSISFNISIDGKKETHLNQRKYRNFHFDYFELLKRNIHTFIDNNFSVEISFVMSIENNNFFQDIIFLIKEFKIPIFIMPEEVLWERVKKKNIKEKLRKYLINMEKTFKLLEYNNLTKFILNYKSFIDIRKHGVGPTIDVNGDIYETRHFVIVRDNKKYKSIGNIVDTNLINHFLNIDLEKRGFENRKIFYGRSEQINLKIGNYFTKILYKL